MESWKEIIDYPGYMVSSAGNVKSLPKKTAPGIRILVQSIDKYGYRVLGLFKDGKQKTFTVHRLVAKAFIPNPQNHPQINHINGIKTDNRVENLEWCDGFHNQTHRIMELGHENYRRKLTRDDVFEILYATPYTNYRVDLAKRFGVTVACIKQVRAGRNYKKWYREYLLGGKTLHEAGLAIYE
jgi:hypothetical protein